MDPDAMDLDTSDPSLQTGLQEIDETLRSSARDGIQRGAQIDRNSARLQWRAELQLRMRAQQDRRAAMQISRPSPFSQVAVLQDFRNHEVNGAPVACPLPAQAYPSTQVLTPNPDVQVQTHPLADIAAITAVPPFDVLRECVACSDSLPESDMVENSCSHVYCQRCVIHLLQNSLVDESLFPPCCCRLPLPLESMRGIIDGELWARFEEKAIEHGDHSRTYCSNSACSRYILPANVHGTTGTCSSCNQQTCTLCKNTTHQGECVDDCPDVLKLARAEGWQRCSKCRHLVELHSGCNHVTCRCRHEFSYVCAMRWKKCECLYWDMARLLRMRVEARVQLAHPARRLLSKQLNANRPA